jgi:hypothetical protein
LTYDFDYIEIGTASFDTLAQQWRKSDSRRGLSVDPVADHLERLPEKRKLIKVHAAIGLSSGWTNVFYIDPDDIAKHSLETWLGGCSMVGRPHPLALERLRALGLERLLRMIPVRIITLAELFTTFCVRSVNTFKVDAEGYDTFIMSSLVGLLEQGHIIPPRSVTYEANWLDTAGKLTMQKINRHMVLNLGYQYRWELDRNVDFSVDFPSNGSIKQKCTKEGASLLSGIVHCANHYFDRKPLKRVLPGTTLQVTSCCQHPRECLLSSAIQAY